MKRGILAVLWALVMLAGCSVLKPPAAPRVAIYALELPADGPKAPAPAGVIVVTGPTAAPGYETQAIVYQRRPLELEQFAYHRWAEPPAEMLSPLLVEALERTGAFAAVVRDPTRVHGDWRVDSQLIRFRQEFLEDGTRRVRAALRVQIASTRSSDLVAARTFETIEPVPETTPEAGVAATNRVVVRLLGEVASFCAEQVANTRPSP